MRAGRLMVYWAIGVVVEIVALITLSLVGYLCGIAPRFGFPRLVDFLIAERRGISIRP